MLKAVARQWCQTVSRDGWITRQHLAACCRPDRHRHIVRQRDRTRYNCDRCLIQSIPGTGVCPVLRVLFGHHLAPALQTRMQQVHACLEPSGRRAGLQPSSSELACATNGCRILPLSPQWIYMAWLRLY